MIERGNNKDAALALARRGFPVFPVHFVRDDGRCSCGAADCKNPAKHPITSAGCLDATTTETTIVNWWTANPGANVAVATGRKAGVFVIDVDGDDLLIAELERGIGKFTGGPCSSTGRGRHLWFQYPNGSSIKNAAKVQGWDIDVRGDGGYVIVPPSIHHSGRQYCWEVELNGSLPDAPQAVLEWLAKSSSGKTMTARGDLDSAPGVAEGERHKTLVEYVGRHFAYGESGSIVLGKAVGWGRKCHPPIDDSEIGRVVQDIEAKHRAQQSRRPAGAERPKAGNPKRSQAASLVDLAVGVELFHNPEGVCFATFEQNGHQETWPIRSGAFRQWLARRYWNQQKNTPGAQAIADATVVLEGHALFDGDELPVFVRVASDVSDTPVTMGVTQKNAFLSRRDVCDISDAKLPTHSNGIVIDLGGADWRAVRITSAGWDIVDRHGVKFRRPRGIRPLPVPERGGSAQLLQGLLNVRTDDWPLVAAWVIGAMRPSGPYPILDLIGEAGSAKSSTARVLRYFTDPNKAPLRREPRNEHDLVIAAHNSWVVTLDNLSRVPPWLSDGLCRLSTGGGFSTRKLYADDEEQIFNVTRPVIINGIEELAIRGDLVDRTLQVSLERIDDADRMPESEYWADVQRHAPQIFGGFLDAVAAALRNQESTSLDRLPRMADFAIWATAGEPTLGLKPGAFLAAYERSAATANETVLESSAVGRAIVNLIENKKLWNGTSSELLAEVSQIASDADRKEKSWPNNSRSMSNRLRRIAPNLRESGISVEFGRAGGGRRTITLILERVCDFASQTSQTSRQVENEDSCVTETVTSGDPNVTVNPPNEGSDIGDDEERPHSGSRILMEI